jgi:hypothetical protein
MHERTEVAFTQGGKNNKYDEVENEKVEEHVKRIHPKSFAENALFFAPRCEQFQDPNSYRNVDQ